MKRPYFNLPAGSTKVRRDGTYVILEIKGLKPRRLDRHEARTIGHYLREIGWEAVEADAAEYAKRNPS